MMTDNIDVTMSSPQGVVLATSGKYCPKNIQVTPTLQNKNTTVNGEITPDSGYSGLSKVTVNVEEPKGLIFSDYDDNGCPTVATIKGTTIPSYYCYHLFGVYPKFLENILTVNIQNTITEIGSYAFNACGALTHITIPNSVVNIGGGTFYNCTGLTTVTLPNNIIKVPASMFYGCSSLTSITIPNNVTSIDNYAFYGCSSLTSITIPNNVTSIGISVFKNCGGLTSVTINAINPPTAGATMFSNCAALTAIYVPADSVNAYKTATNWAIYADIIQAIV